jgi:hypothetical protein
MNSTTVSERSDEDTLGAEVRQSLMLLGVSIGLTAAITVAAQATLSLLG